MKSYDTSIFSSIATKFSEGDGTIEEAWTTLRRSGLTQVSIPENLGGDGGNLADAAAVLRTAGHQCIPLPIAENALLAGWVLATCRTEVPTGPLTLAPVRPEDRVEIRQDREGWVLSGRARRVPWVRDAERVCVLAHAGEGTFVTTVGTRECQIIRGENLAGEPRDDVSFDGVRPNVQEVVRANNGIDAVAIRLKGALTRALLISGALDRVLEQSVGHARERSQFGRPIGRFQAVQHQLALLAGEVAAANAAVDAAVEAVSSQADIRKAEVEVAAAKVRTGLAAGSAAAIAHQVHGAVGFTELHPLRLCTLRLWSWREEFGAEGEWSERLGEMLTTGGAASLWPAATGPASLLEDGPEREGGNNGRR